jgi:riboflavin synthase
MFTGIVSDVGVVRALEKRGDTRIRLGTSYDVTSIAPGISIACAGVCLTVVGTGRDEKGNWFAVDASAATLSATTLGEWHEGRKVNLERALKIGDELGGHIVTGHVDGTGVVERLVAEGDSMRLNLRLPQTLAPFIASKGSVALDGVSLTVNEVEGDCFGVNLIPHTLKVTSLSDLKPGERVNVEIDILARYVARLKACN